MPTTDKNENLRMSEEDLLIPVLRIIQTTSNCIMSEIKTKINKKSLISNVI